MTKRYNFLEGIYEQATPPKTTKPASLSPSPHSCYKQPQYPFQPLVLSHKDPSIKYQQSLAALKGKHYVSKHNALNYYYGYGHRGGDCYCYSTHRKSEIKLSQDLNTLKRDLLRQQRKLKQKAPTRQQWAEFLSKDYKRRVREQAEEIERRRVIPQYVSEWKVLSAQREKQLLGTEEEYIPKIITMKHLIYSKDWGCEDAFEENRGLRQLFKGQDAFLEGDSNL